MATQQLNHILTDLSQNLAIPDTILCEPNKLMQRIFLVLQHKSRYKIDRCRLMGGVAKKTSLWFDFDYDCVIYINDVEPEFKKILDEWQDILTLHCDGRIEGLKVTHSSVQFKIKDVPFDVLPAVNYASYSQDILQQAHTTWQKLEHDRKYSGHSITSINHLYSSALTELAVEFMKKKSGFIHDLCRLAKFWNKTCFFDDYVSGRSSIMEYLAVKAGQEEEQAAINDQLSILRGFRRFLLLLTKYQQLRIVFNDFYLSDKVPNFDRPSLVDPSNPFNNFLSDVPNTFLPKFAKYADETLKRLNRCEKNFEEFTLLFDPQPNLRNHLSNLNPHNVRMLIGIRNNCEEKSSKLIVRRKIFDERSLEEMKERMNCVLQSINTFIREQSKENHMKKVLNATNSLMDRSFYVENSQWQNSNEKHEDYDITFILPLNTLTSHAVYISMSQ